MKKAIIIEDEPVALEDLREALKEIVPDVSITGIQTATEAMDVLAREEFDAIFLDIELPGMSGIQMLERLPKPLPPVVLVTAHALHAIDGFGLGVVECLLKPVDHQRLRRAVAKIQAHPPTNLPSAFRQAEMLHPEARIFCRQGDKLWLVRIEEIWKIRDNNGALEIAFRKGQGRAEGDPSEFRSHLDTAMFFHTSTSETINITMVDHFTNPPDGTVTAVFPDGSVTKFDAGQSRAFIDFHGL